jgi:hypothetical protein
VSDASRFFAANRGLEHAMKGSTAFQEVKREAALDIDDERLYIVRGDTLGSEEDLYLETIVRGAQRDDPNDPYRRVYLELDDELRMRVDERVAGAASERHGTRLAGGGTEGGMA